MRSSTPRSRGVGMHVLVCCRPAQVFGVFLFRSALVHQCHRHGASPTAWGVRVQAQGQTCAAGRMQCDEPRLTRLVAAQMMQVWLGGPAGLWAVGAGG
jgi:hypothetical protein